jgi:hypothetical protein
MTDKPKLVFVPGCFDNFDGTQEELDALISEITSMFESGDFELEATELDIDDEDPEFVDHIMRQLDRAEEFLNDDGDIDSMKLN